MKSSSLFLLFLAVCPPLAGAAEKPRVFVLTDIENKPDDAMSMVRCLTYANHFVTNEWLDRNVRRNGPLGAEYPHWEYLMEGDTPSFLNLINDGLSDPERPNWGGWGGRYELYTPKFEKWPRLTRYQRVIVNVTP